MSVPRDENPRSPDGEDAEGRQPPADCRDPESQRVLTAAARVLGRKCVGRQAAREWFAQWTKGPR
jgi:hypothetical protein